MLDLDEELHNYKVKATQNISNLVSKSNMSVNPAVNLNNKTITYENNGIPGPRHNTLISNNGVANSNFLNTDNIKASIINTNQETKTNNDQFLPGYGDKASNRVTLCKPLLDSCIRAQYAKALNSDWQSIESIKKTYTGPKRQFFPTISSDYCENIRIKRDQKNIKDNRDLIGIKKIGITNMGTSINFDRTTHRASRDMNGENCERIPVIKSCSLKRAKKNLCKNFPTMIKRKILSELTDDKSKGDGSDVVLTDQKGNFMPEKNFDS